jgi:hypothetical protein
VDACLGKIWIWNQHIFQDEETEPRPLVIGHGFTEQYPDRLFWWFLPDADQLLPSHCFLSARWVTGPVILEYLLACAV